MAENIGSVVQIIGPVVDVEFDGTLPAIYNAVIVQDAGHGHGRARSTSSRRWRSTSAKTACAASRWSRPTAWSAA